VVGGAAAFLPALITGEGSGSGTRFVVASSLGITGVLGFLAQHPGRPLPRNVAANRSARESWQRQVDSMIAENSRRAAAVQLRVVPGVVTRSEREAP
jgi:hypothetical protein